MERLFVDTNIVLDVLQKRKDFYKEAQELFSLAENKEVKLYVSALTIANTHYLLSKYLNENEARNVLRTFKMLVEVLALNDKIINLSLNSDFKDFEDGLQFYTAMEENIDLIITRNKKDFRNALIPVLTAKEYLNRK